MSVIAKMNTYDEPRLMNGRHLYELQCVYDSDLANEGNENYRFTQASPSGTARLWCDDIGLSPADEVYVIFTRGEIPEAFDGAIVARRLRVVSVTDYGGTSKKVEIASHYSESDGVPEEIRAASINLRMSIDNPRAAVQFEPGKDDYWMRIYPAKRFTMAQALELADA